MPGHDFSFFSLEDDSVFIYALLFFGHILLSVMHNIFLWKYMEKALWFIMMRNEKWITCWNTKVGFNFY